VVLGVHEPEGTTECFFGQISQHVAIMSYPEVPLGVAGVYSREEANRMSGHLYGMLIAEHVDGLQSCSLKSVNKAIANHINLDGLPLRAERMLRNSHPDSAPRNSFLPILHTVVLWGLGVEEQAKRFPQKTWKTLPVQDIGVKVPCRIPEDVWRSCHLKQEFRW
jgi:hypothetical protein